MSKKKILYVSDQKYYKSQENKWFTTASFPIELFDVFGDIEEWIFFGRLYEIKNTDKLYELSFEKENFKVSFAGIQGGRSGLGGYLIHIFQYFSLLNRNIKNCDTIYLKFSFIASYIAGMIFKSENKFLITHMVGDIECIKLIRNNIFISFMVIIQKQIYKHIAKKANLQIYVSKDLMNKYMFGSAKTVTINENRIKDENIISAQKIKRRAVGDTFRLLFVGRISPEKGLIDIIYALKKKSNITLDIIGIGDISYTKKIKLIIRENGLDSSVRFLGYVKWGSDLFDKFSNYHSLILPSYSEGLPLVIVEAMSMGLPVIASNVGGIPEILKHRENGLIFLPGDINGITENINIIQMDENLRYKIMMNGLITAHRYSLENQMKVFKEALYE